MAQKAEGASGRLSKQREGEHRRATGSAFLLGSSYLLQRNLVEDSTERRFSVVALTSAAGITADIAREAETSLMTQSDIRGHRAIVGSCRKKQQCRKTICADRLRGMAARAETYRTSGRGRSGLSPA